jgi:uncharacterized delta-60 repeat protein
MAIDADGKILVTGSSYNGDNDDMAIWRYNADGTLDTTFGAPNGFVVHNSAAGGDDSNDCGYAITITAQGKILVTGYSNNSDNNSDMVIWRYNADGTLDETFGEEGFVVHNSAAGGNGNDSGYAITVDNQDRILVTGESDSEDNADMVIWRYDDEGTLDDTFGTGGIVKHNSAAGGNSFDYGKAIAIDSNGKILVAGYSSNGINSDMAIWRYTSAGVLDTVNFGAPNGFIVYDGNVNKGDYGNAIALDSGGKILVTGFSGNSSNNFDMALWRYNADGTLDTTFNSDGVITHDGAAGLNSDDYAYAIAIDSNGKILVAGSSYNLFYNIDMVIWRYTSTGALDTTFDTDGIVFHNSANGINSDDYGYAIAINAGGKILVAGSSKYSSSDDTAIAIWRYTSTGALDTAFGLPNGFVIHRKTAGGNGDDEGCATVTDAQGRILVTGSSHNISDYDDMVIWRYNGDGTLDTTFGTGGVVSYNGVEDDDDRGYAITVTAQGKILVAGSIYASSGGDMAIWRYNDDGTPDTTFDSDGVVTHTSAAGAVGFSPDCGNAIAIDAQGKILVTGESLNTAGNYDMVIWRYTADGTLDTTFDSDGVVTHTNAAGGTNKSDYGRVITIDADGKILVAGYSGNSSNNNDMIIYRYLSDGTLDTTFGTGGIAKYNSIANKDDCGNAITIDADGKILVSGSTRNSDDTDDMVIWRYTITGTLDTTFNSVGFVVHDGAAGKTGGNDYGYGITIDSDGKILVTGWSNNESNMDMVVWRYTSSGALDDTFDSDGIVVHDGAAGSGTYDGGSAITIDAGGNILVAGFSSGYMVIWRYLATGELDGDPEEGDPE